MTGYSQSIIECVDISKNTKFTGLNTLLYG